MLLYQFTIPGEVEQIFPQLSRSLKSHRDTGDYHEQGIRT